MESWDDDNFEPPPVVPAAVPVPSKWVGEDEDDDVKDNWEDEEEEKDESTNEVKPKPKKLSLAERIAEKERRKREEMEKRLREQEDEMTPEERLRMQKESDLKVALETTFGGDQTNDSGIDGLSMPNTKEEFQEFTEALSKKLLPLSKSTEYPLFVENIMRNICATMSSLDIKKIKNTLDNLYLEKQKFEKGDKSKKNKGKGKAKLKMDDGNPLSAYTTEYDDFDDFM